MKNIIIIEDDKKIRDELSIFLSRNGYICEVSTEFENIIYIILSSKVDLVLLDINLPNIDGYYICREIRKNSDIPIIVVTSRDTEMDELMAMNLGADDFIPKPYNTQILLAHIASVLKRTSKDTIQERIDCGSFYINISKSTIVYQDTETELTKNELKILLCLQSRKGSIVSRDELMTELWNSDMFVDDNTLTVNINRLRNKLDGLGLKEIIETKRGRGYIIN